MGWIEYWNGKPSIYVSERHKLAHYRGVADGILAHLHRKDLSVLDYGCGEALFAGDIAGRCSRLYLCDAARNVRGELERRFSPDAAIDVLAPEHLTTISPGSLDLIIVNSVVQYLTLDDLTRNLAIWRRLLASDGRLLLADVIPRSVGAATDALALLTFASRHGFVASAIGGLARTFFSSYRTLRNRHGLQQLDESEVLGHLSRHGFAGARVHPNIGHNQARMAFIATPMSAIGEARQAEAAYVPVREAVRGR